MERVNPGELDSQHTYCCIMTISQDQQVLTFWCSGLFQQEHGTERPLLGSAYLPCEHSSSDDPDFLSTKFSNAAYGDWGLHFNEGRDS
jgi:hypothetical protein